MRQIELPELGGWRRDGPQPVPKPKDPWPDYLKSAQLLRRNGSRPVSIRGKRSKKLRPVLGRRRVNRPMTTRNRAERAELRPRRRRKRPMRPTRRRHDACADPARRLSGPKVLPVPFHHRMGSRLNHHPFDSPEYKLIFKWKKKRNQLKLIEFGVGCKPIGFGNQCRSCGCRTRFFESIPQNQRYLKFGGDLRSEWGSATKQNAVGCGTRCRPILKDCYGQRLETTNEMNEITESLRSYPPVDPPPPPPPPVDPPPSPAEEGSLRSRRRFRVKSTIDLLKNGVVDVADVVLLLAPPFRDRSLLIDPSSIDLFTEESSLDPNGIISQTTLSSQFIKSISLMATSSASGLSYYQDRF